MTPRERSIAVGDTELYLREWEAQGPPVLFWHALGDHTSMQIAEAAPILAKWFGYRVIGVDAPGFGCSPRVPDERYEIPALVSLARDLLDALGVERPVWSGSSWGAIVGVHLGGAHPERIAALISLDGGYTHSSKGKTLEELKERFRGDEGFAFASWDELFADARNHFGRWSPELETGVRPAFREENGRVVSIMGTDVYAAAIYGIEQSPPWPALERLGRSGLPVLLFVATEVPEEIRERDAAGLRRFAELVPQADIRVVERAPHFLLENRPGEVARTMGGWLQALPYA